MLSALQSPQSSTCLVFRMITQSRDCDRVKDPLINEDDLASFTIIEILRFIRIVYMDLHNDLPRRQGAPVKASTLKNLEVEI
jgi:hypothetical protein